MNILLASPGTFESRVIQSLLGEWQHEVVVVRTGQAALAKLMHEAPPDVALLEAALPGMDGFSLCRWIRSHLASRPPHVIVISGAADEFTRRQATGTGVNAVLVKPFHLAELSEQLAQAENTLQLHQRDMQRLSLAVTQRTRTGFAG